MAWIDPKDHFTFSTPPEPGPEAADGEEPIATKQSGHEIADEALRWIWPGYLVEGKLHILAGKPGTGKTTIAMHLAAVVSNGGSFPDGASCEPGDVFIWSGEDHFGDALLPRLRAAGAALEHVHFVGSKLSNGERFNPAEHISALERLIRKTPTTKMLIIDTIASIATGDSHNNADIRQALEPWVEMGQRLGVATLGIAHFSKNTQGRDPLDRVTGSMAFGALARVVLGTARMVDDQGDDSETCVLVRVKSNYGKTGGGFAYHLETQPQEGKPQAEVVRVRFGDALPGGAKRIFNTAEGVYDGRQTEEARDCAEWLDSFLSGGPMPKQEIVMAAKQEGYSLCQLRGARERLKLGVSRNGFGPNTRTMWGRVRPFARNGGPTIQESSGG